MNAQHPSSKKLVLATIGAALVALLLLVTVVLPAEYGIDPLGTGRALGLTKLSEAKSEPTIVESATPVQTARSVEAPAEPASDAVANAPQRSDRTELTLRPGQGAEIKATMQIGHQMQFLWQTDGEALYFDFHGDEFNAPKDVFTSYKEGTESRQEGSFTANFGGVHGWYWENRSGKAVTVILTTSGTYEAIRRL